MYFLTLAAIPFFDPIELDPDSSLLLGHPPGETTIELHVFTKGMDSDSDGVADWWEYEWDMDPFRFDSDIDPDGDGFTNLEEFLGNDGEWGDVDDSTDPKDFYSRPVRERGEQPNGLFFILLGSFIAFLVLATLGFIFTRRKL